MKVKGKSNQEQFEAVRSDMKITYQITYLWLCGGNRVLSDLLHNIHGMLFLESADFCERAILQIDQLGFCFATDLCSFQQFLSRRYTATRIEHQQKVRSHNLSFPTRKPSPNRDKSKTDNTEPNVNTNLRCSVNSARVDNFLLPLGDSVTTLLLLLSLVLWRAMGSVFLSFLLQDARVLFRVFFCRHLYPFSSSTIRYTTKGSLLHR